MVYKGCVVKVEKSFAIVFTSSGECLKVVKKEGLTTGKEILFIEEDIYKEKPSMSKSFSLIAAVFMLFFLSATVYTTLQRWLPMQQVAAVVSIDINPSVELEINRANQVLRSLALNEEGEQLLDESLVGLAAEDAVVQLVDKAKNLQYITEERKTILISTVVLKEETKFPKPQLEDVILKKLDEKESFQEIEVLYLKGKKEDLPKAREEKISIGKYEVFLNAIEEKQPVTVEEIKKAKVQELVERGIGKLKTKEVQKNKSKADEKKEEEIEKKEEDLPDDKKKNESQRQTDQKEKKSSNASKKEGKEQLEKPAENNKPPAEQKKPQEQKPEKTDKKEDDTSSSSEGKTNEEKELQKQKPVREKTKPEEIKHVKDEDSPKRENKGEKTKKEDESKKQKNIKNISPHNKKP
ncbi:anti-sigma factor domain-containing protein [Geosporobacter ferrireducens]|uniref:RsgI N-terminal anti-sigma domain-containing protein n=1 Tax=Geosporobacter ferrireducens TaxID=1424294 RepID=A0A1D8GGB8_9FIRM|nr:anti-sigma factor domain-containing protein [Geosporobacter ferrireducens]AOT69970.1 hypothetical protein Gferi_10460 [Geosporobacter ferrireducens]MTI58353.1 anti-sigma factor domain-containing protein [Geosporobacter ferrireducens]